MATRIVPRIVRGCLNFDVGSVLLPAFAEAACTWHAAEAHRLDLVDLIDGTSLNDARKLA